MSDVGTGGLQLAARSGCLSRDTGSLLRIQPGFELLLRTGLLDHCFDFSSRFFAPVAAASLKDALRAIGQTRPRSITVPTSLHP